MDEESWLDGDENWLQAEILSCPACGVRLFCEQHSPMCDDYRLYCDTCPRAVEVSLYDSVYQDLAQGLPENHTWEQMADHVGPHLKPCVCGGHYGATDVRHCFQCRAVIPAAAGRDVAPYVGYEDTEREPTAEEQDVADRFTREFIRDEDLWIQVGP